MLGHSVLSLYWFLNVWLHGGFSVGGFASSIPLVYLSGTAALMGTLCTSLTTVSQSLGNELPSLREITEVIVGGGVDSGGSVSMGTL